MHLKRKYLRTVVLVSNAMCWLLEHGVGHTSLSACLQGPAIRLLFKGPCACKDVSTIGGKRYECSYAV